MPQTTTIAAGSSAAVSLAAGSVLVLSGTGFAQVAPPLPGGATSLPMNIGTGATRIGPFPITATVNVTATAGGLGVSYYADAPGDVQDDTGAISWTAAQMAAAQPNNQLVTGAATGWSSGWLAAWPHPERFAFQPTGISGTASITIEGSLDGATAAATLGVMSLTSADNTKQSYTPPLIVGYPYVRITVTADGGGTHSIARGV